MIMSASETPIEGSPAVGRNIAIAVAVAVTTVVAIIIVLLLLSGGLSIPSGGGG